MSNSVDMFKWNCETLVKKFHGDSTDPLDQYDELWIPGNGIAMGGVSIIWEALIAGTYTSFANANAAIGVGDSTTANGSPLVFTDLQASTNKLRKAMDSTYPQHTDGTAQTNSNIVFRSTFGSSDANFAWQEWGVFNSATGGSGRMLNRKVESLGTKAVNSTWQLTVTLSISSP